MTDQIDRSVLSHSGESWKLIARFRQRRRQYRRRHGAAARHHRHQHAGRPDRGHRRHDHGADPGGAAAPAEGAQVLTSDSAWTAGPTWMLGHRIWGKRLGIVGMGRIGQAVARRAKAFGLQIHYHNRRRVARASRRSSTPPTGRASTRCWCAWTSSRSVPAHAGHLSPLCRRGGSEAHSSAGLCIVKYRARRGGSTRNALARLIEARRDGGRRSRCSIGARAGGEPLEASVKPRPRRQGRACCRISVRRRPEGRVDMGEKVIG